MNKNITDIISKGVPEPRTEIIYSRFFDPKEYKKIQGFNDIENTFSPRWGAVFHDLTLYLYRTWTQHCIFTVHFSQNGTTTHITACRNSNIYDSLSDEYDISLMDDLIKEMILNEL